MSSNEFSLRQFFASWVSLINGECFGRMILSWCVRLFFRVKYVCACCGEWCLLCAHIGVTCIQDASFRSALHMCAYACVVLCVYLRARNYSTWFVDCICCSVGSSYLFMPIKNRYKQSMVTPSHFMHYMQLLSRQSSKRAPAKLPEWPA